MRLRWTAWKEIFERRGWKCSPWWLRAQMCFKYLVLCILRLARDGITNMQQILPYSDHCAVSTCYHLTWVMNVKRAGGNYHHIFLDNFLDLAQNAILCYRYYSTTFGYDPEENEYLGLCAKFTWVQIVSVQVCYLCGLLSVLHHLLCCPSKGFYATFSGCVRTEVKWPSIFSRYYIWTGSLLQFAV